MKVTFYGTRGSQPTCDANYLEYGGRTTCVRVESDCLPEKNWLSIDAGTGIYPLSEDGLKAGIERLSVFFTHYHPDHTDGLLLSPLLFIPKIQLDLFGPVEKNFGPERVYRHKMFPPLFPVHFDLVKSHLAFFGLKDPSSQVVIFHPKGGRRLISICHLQTVESSQNQQIHFENGAYDLAECLVIKMVYSHHPERTISYRFEERPTGKVFVFLTDHENEDYRALPINLAGHLKNADLLVMDCQYTSAKYERTAGFGHGTPDYCVRIAKYAGIPRLGLTHHDIPSRDADVHYILNEAILAAHEQIGYQGDIFACSDDLVCEI